MRQGIHTLTRSAVRSDTRAGTFLITWAACGDLRCSGKGQLSGTPAALLNHSLCGWALSPAVFTGLRTSALCCIGFGSSAELPGAVPHDADLAPGCICPSEVRGPSSISPCHLSWLWDKNCRDVPETAQNTCFSIYVSHTSEGLFVHMGPGFSPQNRR